MLTVGFFYLVNKIVTHFKYKNFKVIGGEHIPASGSFLLIANHTSRWDGCVLMETMRRSANWMVSPNELKGFQGICLRSVGAFPADRRFELLNYVAQRIAKGEPVVIFPEGNIFKEKGLDLPVVSIAIHYIDKDSVNIIVSRPVHVDHNRLEQIEDHNERIRTLTSELHAKLSRERTTLESGNFQRLLENVC
jgi:1-acyl-sn-glycerol-3-phosphate acyltransferase